MVYKIPVGYSTYRTKADKFNILIVIKIVMIIFGKYEILK